jgi:hypothetical protein
MASLTELLDDKKTYPDEMKVTLASGVEATIGDLRSGYMKDADYRKKTSTVAEERRRLETERQEFLQAKTDAELQLQAMAEKIITRQPDKGQDEIDAELEDDPKAKKLMAKIAAAEAKAEEAVKRSAAIEEARTKEREAAMVHQHRQVLWMLKEKDKDLDTEALVNYAKQNGLGRLDIAYRLMTEDSRISKATEEAKQRGIEEGKKMASQPNLSPRKPLVTSLPKDAPQDFDSALDAAASDPEILGIMGGQE